MKKTLKILLCDDDVQFAQNQTANLLRKLKTRHSLSEGTCWIHPLSNLSEIRKIASNPEEAGEWDAIFCDLGWGDLTLEGIQLLHDIKINHPSIFTLLYTAQYEDEIIGQTLEWKLSFVDRILKVGERGFFEKLMTAVMELLQEEKIPADSVKLIGARLLPDAMSSSHLKKLMTELRYLKGRLQKMLRVTPQETFAAEIDVSSREIRLKLKQDPASQQQQKLQQLLDSLERFPRLSPHDLLPLSKTAYIEFIKKVYGGFPQMAEVAGLDLNNIYRVNRRFKSSPFVVFKYDTIQIILGVLDPANRENQLRELLSPAAVIQKMI